MIFVSGIVFGGSLFDVEVAFVTVIWVAVWTLPFVIGYALKYTRKHPRRLVWAASWAWLVVALYVILTLLSSGILG
jgi:amino acid transporter